MKRTTLTLFAFFILIQCHAQRIEWAFSANSGVYRYTGNNTVSTTFFNGVTANTKQGYVNNPYGNLFGFSYGAGFQAQRITPGGFIIGLQADYEILRSKESIDNVYPEDPNFVEFTDIAANIVSTTGKANLVSQDLTFNPYIGYRIRTKKLRIDLMPGIDLSYNFSVHEYGSAKDQNGATYQVSYYSGTMSPDLRLRFGAAAWYKKFALTASYAHGLTNFSSHLLNDNPTPMYTKSELVRFGLAYKLN